MPNVLSLVPLIPALPLLGMLITGLAGRFLTRSGLRMVAAYIACAMVLLSLLISIGVAINIGEAGEEGRYIFSLYPWITSGDFNVDIGFYVDSLTSVMLIVVTGVASLVHIYAIGYMRDEGRDPSVVAHHGGHDEHGAE